MRVSSGAPSPWANGAPKVRAKPSRVSRRRFIAARQRIITASQRFTSGGVMNQPWLEHYDPGVPRSIGAYPDKTLVDFVAEHGADRGDGAAVLFKGRTISWRELHRESDALAHS